MPGGSCCAIFGCPAQKATNRGLTFHKLPKKGKNDDWRDALIRKINRIDHLFNPDKATICSRHFLSSCFKYGPSGVRFLIPGSLPTEYMPCKSVETPKPPPRRPPPIRPPPAVPERVAYYSFAEVQKDAQSLPAAWCLLSSQANQITVGVVDLVLDVVTMKVTVSDDFTVDLFIKGKKVPNVTVSLERQKLRDYLNQVAVAKMCDGITDASLQQYADVLESPSKQVYYREVTWDGSVIRAVDCSLLIQGAPSDLQLCRACKQAKRSVLKKKARAVSTLVPVGKHAPLKVLSKEKLLRALKTLRKENKVLEGKLKHLMTKLPDESIEVVSPLHGVSNPSCEISSHVREGRSPLYEVCSLLREGSRPVLKVSPVHGVNSPLREGSSPLHEGNSPLQEGRSSLHKGSSPLHEGSSPLHEVKSPLHEGSSPVFKVSPVHEGSSPLHEGSSPLHEGNSPLHEVSNPLREGSSPLQKGGSPLHYSIIYEGCSF